MKKILVLSLTIVLTLAIATVSMASTMGVNVSKGNSICFEKDPVDTNPLYVTGNFGVSDKLLLSFGTGINDGEDSYSFGGRYEIIENLAVGFKFADSSNAEELTIDLRGKYAISDQLALTGKIAYTDGDGSDEFGLTAQAEYAVSDNFIPTFALSYSDPDNESSSTTATIGMDFYPTDKFFIYLDYYFDVDDTDDDAFYLGLEFAL